MLVFLLAMRIPVRHDIFTLGGQIDPFITLLAEDTVRLNVAGEGIVLEELDAFGLRLPCPCA